MSKGLKRAESSGPSVEVVDVGVALASFGKFREQFKEIHSTCGDAWDHETWNEACKKVEDAKFLGKIGIRDFQKIKEFIQKIKHSNFFGTTQSTTKLSEKVEEANILYEGLNVNIRTIEKKNPHLMDEPFHRVSGGTVSSGDREYGDHFKSGYA